MLAINNQPYKVGEIRLPKIEKYGDFLKGEGVNAHASDIQNFVREGALDVPQLFENNNKVPVYELCAGSGPNAGLVKGLENAQARSILAPFSKELRSRLNILEGIANRFENGNKAALDFIGKSEFKKNSFTTSMTIEANEVIVNIPKKTLFRKKLFCLCSSFRFKTC